MKVARTLRKMVASAVLSLAAVGVGVGDAAAGWVFIGDLDLSDSATNPGYPANQNAVTVGTYLQDLLNLPSAPASLPGSDTYGGAPLTGLGDPVSPNSLFLAFHFGNGNDYWVHTDNFDVFFSCASGCDSFSLPSTKGVSNYRLYEASVGTTNLLIDPTQEVPEPMTLALFGLGLLGIGLSRRRA